MEQNRIVNFSDYSSTNVIGSSPQTKTVPIQPPQTYYQIPLAYNYGKGKAKIVDDFMLEGPELSSPYGIQSKLGANAKYEDSLMVRFDSDDEDQSKFVEVLNQIHDACAKILGPVKGQVKMHNFNKDMAEATGLRGLVYYPRDKVTGDLVEGKAPSMFFRLKRAYNATSRQSTFFGLDQKIIDWRLLQGVSLRFIPLIHIKWIYIGSKASIQMEVVSVIVTDVKSNNATIRQLDTINRIQKSDPSKADSVSSQLAKISLEKNNMADANQDPEPQEAKSAPSTMDGFMSTVPQRSDPQLTRLD